MNTLNSIEEVKATIASSDLTLVLLSDMGCNVCLAITPELEALAKLYPKAAFISGDAHVVKALVGEFMVFVYPTIIIFAQGKETKRFERVFSVDDIHATLDRYYNLLY